MAMSKHAFNKFPPLGKPFLQRHCLKIEVGRRKARKTQIWELEKVKGRRIHCDLSVSESLGAGRLGSLSPFWLLGGQTLSVIGSFQQTSPSNTLLTPPPPHPVIAEK